jgi:hypothetical protein
MHQAWGELKWHPLSRMDTNMNMNLLKKGTSPEREEGEKEMQVPDSAEQAGTQLGSRSYGPTYQIT